MIDCRLLELICSRALACQSHVGAFDLIAALTAQILHTIDGHVPLYRVDEFGLDGSLVDRMATSWTRPDAVWTARVRHEQLDVFAKVQIAS